MQETWKMVVINIVIIIKKFEYNRVEYIYNVIIGKRWVGYKI